MIDRYPGLILRCTSTNDMVAAVTVARENGLLPSVRCEPWIGTGVYVNMLNFDEMHRVVEAFGVEKYARLGRIKAQYDPGNLFQMNYNIKPVTG